MLRRLILFTVVLISINGLYAQEQGVVDRLRPLYESDTLSTEHRIKVLNKLTYHEVNDLQMALKYAQELIELSKSVENNKYLREGYLQKGYILLDLGDLVEAVKAFEQSAARSKEDGHYLGEAVALIAVADIYAEAGDIERAEKNYLQSIDLLREIKEEEFPKRDNTLGIALFNLGDLYLETQRPGKAIDYFSEAGALFDKVGYSVGSYSVIGNLGRAYLGLGNYEQAEAHLKEAIESLRTANYASHIAAYQAALATLYSNQGKYEMAHVEALASLKLVQETGQPAMISEYSKLLSDIDEKRGVYQESLEHLNMHLEYKDSLDGATVDMTRLQWEKAENEAEMAKLQSEKAQNELALQSLQQKRQQLILWITGITALLLIVIALGTYRRYQYTKKTSDIISRERDRAETLLLNILPKQTASELKENGKVKAQRYNDASVLFTDFRNFTKHAEEVDPGLLVKSLDYYFSYFDTLMDKYGLEKIKTVGDAYMCAAGIPFPVEDHARRVVDAALEMLDFVEEAKHHEDAEHIRFDIRIGINSGPVVAGIVGTKKFAYDIWGDTVNIAARMESSSVPGKVNVAEHTYQLIKDRYQCQYRGEIEAKNRGKLKMYFVSGKKEPSEKAPKSNEPVLAD
ncbi:adenylate/guanylate cyclase domain-containing protein [Robiginitalea sp. IMCC44478]|uniref:adenylate/guanylate cyclase domain-containing protein n=1 Tax=Robiginitalea sp. IMCC44478 TaxID=3459122 RepID=UPI004042639E